MFSTRPITPLVRRPALHALLPSADVLRRRIDTLPHSPNHGRMTSRALYAVGLSQAMTAVVYAALVISSYTGAIIPVDSKVLFIIPMLIALLGVAMTAIGVLGSVSAPWMAVVVSLPLALTALYVEGALASLVLVALVLAPAVWLCRHLITDADQRQRAAAEADLLV